MNAIKACEFEKLAYNNSLNTIDSDGDKYYTIFIEKILHLSTLFMLLVARKISETHKEI